MKTPFRAFLLSLFLLLPVGLFAQQAKLSEVYMFGVGINFTDSTAYLSAVQRIEAVPLDASKKFLLNRYAYSEQLYRYLYTQAEKRNETCLVFYARSRRRAEKDYLRLRRRLHKERGQHNVVEIPGDAFHFTAVPYVNRMAAQQ